MEPLGTITMYYQFLDREIVDILDEIMQEAKDYRDFCERLVDYVCAEDVPPVLGYLAGVHAGNMGTYGLPSRLRQKFGEMAHIYGLIGGESERFHYPGEWIEVALAENHEDWIKTMLCHVKSWMYDRESIQEISKYLDLGMEFIDKNPKLECFRSYLLQTRSLMKSQEGRLEDAIVDLEEGLRIARKYDDRFQTSLLLFLLGSSKRNLDVNASWEYFDEAFRIADSIGYTQGAAFAIARMGGVAYVRGEYDLALQSLFRCREMCAEAGIYMDTVSLWYARIYSNMREGSQALLWARTATEELGLSGTLLSTLERARALILLGRLKEASAELDSAKDLVLKDGREDHLGLYKNVSGLLEVAEGRTLEGMSNLEEALDIFDLNSNELLAVPCLIELARAEVNNDAIGGDFDTSGPWMDELEKRARERDYPGILMEHAFLKAEFQMKHGAHEAARKTLTDGLKILDSPSVKTLRDKIEERLLSLAIDA
ncbi:MAG: hypothetical protein ACFFCT_13180 [Candidatus Odinarchaeota archaeon]